MSGHVVGAGECRGDVLIDREAAELLQAYHAIPRMQRHRLFDLARLLSGAGADAVSAAA